MGYARNKKKNPGPRWTPGPPPTTARGKRRFARLTEEQQNFRRRRWIGSN